MQLALKYLVTPDPATIAADTDVVLSLPVGKSVLLKNVDWQTFETILT